MSEESTLNPRDEEIAALKADKDVIYGQLLSAREALTAANAKVEEMELDARRRREVFQQQLEKIAQLTKERDELRESNEALSDEIDRSDDAHTAELARVLTGFYQAQTHSILQESEHAKNWLKFHGFSDRFRWNGEAFVEIQGMQKLSGETIGKASMTLTESCKAFEGVFKSEPEQKAEPEQVSTAPSPLLEIISLLKQLNDTADNQATTLESIYEGLAEGYFKNK